MKLPRTLRLDPSDTFVFAKAAEAGEWAVSGSFMFFDTDLDALATKERAALRAGFLGLSSFGWSTLCVVTPVTEGERAVAVESLAHFIRDFIDHKGYGKVNLLGNSLGGHVALVYCKEHPERVNSLTLTASSGLYENAFGSSFPRREDKEFIRQKVGLTFFDPKHATDELVDECFEIVNDRNRVLRILALAKSAIRHNMAKELPAMKFPVCLIWGKNDTITPPEVAEEFHQLLTNSSLYWIDECGHAPMMEHPQRFNELLDAWMKEKGI